MSPNTVFTINVTVRVKKTKQKTPLLNIDHQHNAKACLRKGVLWEPKQDSSDK